MSRLKVRLRGKVISEIRLEDGKTYVAGRKEDCTILLQAEKGISREHFQLSSESGRWELKVLSRFGDVLVGGEKVQSLVLEEAQIFSVPPYEFEFSMADQSAPSVSGPTPTPMPTTTESEAGLPVLTQDSGGGQDFSEGTVVGSSGLVPVLRYLDEYQNTKRSLSLEGGTSFMAGRESSCQIQIEDQRASRKQFEIKKIANSFFITDLGSANGTYVNGEMLNANEPNPLKSGDTITVLENQMVFELHDPNFQKAVSEFKALAPMSQIPATYQPQSQAPAHYDPNLYQQPAYYPPMANHLPAGFNWKKNRIRIVIGVLGLILVVGLISGGGSDKPKKPKIVKNDPLSSLTDDQKMMVKHHYQLAENYLAQQKWGLAKDEIEKIKNLLPQNYRAYERTEEIEMNAEQGFNSEKQLSEIEEQERQKIIQEQRIISQVELCQKLVTPQVLREDLENCLQPVLQFNPDHPQIQQIRSRVDSIVTQRLIQQQQKAEDDRKAAQMKQMFDGAERLERSQDFLDAIASYERVVRASLPDRGGYKSKAKRQIAAIKAKMNSQTAAYLTKAEKLAQEARFKEAIVSLRSAKKIDPTNSYLDEKIDNYKRELTKNMQILFQEGVLEEGFGNIEGNSERPGAKDKWKKILELDIPDGDYYLKAKQRLKKYGVI